MKFITEMELRDLYKTEPFTIYVLEPNAKLTPGARQFLTDRGVKLGPALQSSDSKCTDAGKSETAQGQESWCVQRLRGRMAGVESLFLLTGSELLSCREAGLAEEVLVLGKFFSNVKSAERTQIALDTAQFGEWSEVEISKFANGLDNCFAISEVQVRLANGKAIALLNHLRAALREVEPAMLEAYWDEAQQLCLRQDLIDKVNLIINILCIMMWKSLGGQQCQY